MAGQGIGVYSYYTDMTMIASVTGIIIQGMHKNGKVKEYHVKKTVNEKRGRKYLHYRFCGFMLYVLTQRSFPPSSTKFVQSHDFPQSLLGGEGPTFGLGLGGSQDGVHSTSSS